MTDFETEIIDAHIAIENWLGKGEGELTSLLGRFRHDFRMIAPTGAAFDYPALACFFEAQRATRQGLKIVIDQLTTIDTWSTGAVLHYRETQTLSGHPGNVRCSTAVLTRQGDKITWRLLHETAQG